MHPLFLTKIFNLNVNGIFLSSHAIFHFAGKCTIMFIKRKSLLMATQSLDDQKVYLRVQNTNVVTDNNPLIGGP
ncbi:hypothetical protein TYRP_000006 [Tyrophagus putrescentiae]|nr:hypothetical protein TYRP_000006 [Tyrophagus putrescentiae]